MPAGEGMMIGESSALILGVEGGLVNSGQTLEVGRTTLVVGVSSAQEGGILPLVDTTNNEINNTTNNSTTNNTKGIGYQPTEHHAHHPPSPASNIPLIKPKHRWIPIIIVLERDIVMVNHHLPSSRVTGGMFLGVIRPNHVMETTIITTMVNSSVGIHRARLRWNAVIAAATVERPVIILDNVAVIPPGMVETAWRAILASVAAHRPTAHARQLPPANIHEKY